MIACGCLNFCFTLSFLEKGGLFDSLKRSPVMLLEVFIWDKIEPFYLINEIKMVYYFHLGGSFVTTKFIR